MTEATKPVLIVGAGPTGLTAALELSRLGVPVRLVERSPSASTTSRAIGVQARTLELLEQRGLAESLIKLGNKGSAASFYGGGKRLFRLEFDQIDSKFNYLLFVSEAETEKILREAVEKAGIAPERDLAMVAFAQSEHLGSISATLQHGNGTLQQFECSYMIAAEGAHSIARATLDLQFEGKSLPEDYALGDLYIDGDLPDSDLHIFSSEHGFLGMFPLGNRHFRLIASNPISKPAKDTEPSLNELQEIFDQRSDIPARFRDLSWSSWFRINSRMVSTLHAGKVFLGGDSAHIHSPAGGQGMNTGIQDMINLSWKMAMVIKGHAEPELLDTYSDDRIPVIRDVLAKTEGLTQAIGSENTLFRSVFNHIAPWIVSTEMMQHIGAERLSQLSLNYRKSPLSVSHGHSGELRAGDRVPDLQVSVLNREGSSEHSPAPASLFSLMNPSLFTLFYSNPASGEKAHSEVRKMIGQWQYLIQTYQIAAAENQQATFKKIFGDASFILLVRPDAYVGFVGNENSIPELAKYCDKWLIPEREPVSTQNAQSGSN